MGVKIVTSYQSSVISQICCHCEPERRSNLKEILYYIKIASGFALAMTIVSFSFLPVACYAESEIQGVKIDNERISLDLKGVEISEVLRLFSLKMNLTIVSSKNVAGRVNIFLNNLTFNDALDVLLINQDLACDKKGSIINIMTAEEYQQLFGKKYNEKRKIKTIKLVYAKPSGVFAALSQLKSDIGKIIADEISGTLVLVDIPEKIELMENTVRELDRPLDTEIFDIKYAKSADLKTHLTSAITSGPGELYVDERSAKVMISDLPDKMDKLKRMIAAFDEASRQVFIEAEIVQITLRKEYQRGMNWEKFFMQDNMDNLDFKGTFPSNASFTSSPLLSASNLQMAIGVLGRDNYTSTIQLLEGYGDTKVLSRPRIACINNQEAKIMVGSREAYITQTQSQATSTTVTSESIQFIDVGIKLNVVPTIGVDGYITMKIKPEVSSVRETLTSTLGSKVPIVETAEAETVVKVKDGSMIMIAGLMKEEKRKDEAGIPYLSKIPILGLLFRSFATQKKNTEIIVFLSPRIITGEEPLAGTEFEKRTPPEIIPDDIAQKIFTDKLNKIKARKEPGHKKNPSFDFSSRSETGEVKDMDIKSKIKPMKEG